MAVDLLHRVRIAARAGHGIVLEPEHVQVLLSDPVYAALTRLERDALLNSMRESAEVRHQSHSALSAPKPNLAATAGDRFLSEAEQCSVEDLIAEWLKFHVSLLAAPDRYHYSAAHLKTFFNDERRAGRLGDKVMVKDLTPELQARFREWRSASGVGGHTVSRDLAALRGALTWAWKHQRIERPPPFIADVPAHARANRAIDGLVLFRWDAPVLRQRRTVQPARLRRGREIPDAGKAGGGVRRAG